MIDGAVGFPGCAEDKSGTVMNKRRYRRAMEAGVMDMNSVKSRLIKPIRYWSEDLPDPEEEQKVFPRLIRVNEINDVWMEIPRYRNVLWTGIWL